MPRAHSMQLRLLKSSSSSADEPAVQPRHWRWVDLMHRAFALDVQWCAAWRNPSCEWGGISRLSALRGGSGFVLLAFNNLVRASILYFIALQDSERRDVLEILDRSVFDPSEVARLRGMANEYWGLTGQEDEMLCSGRWAA